ncbi:MAG: hypothetical protein A2X77_05585 [Gammaproteobacteria bacterium GWE2_42_36]|nr:MAG: hypothetical protein A2X77_05585 [Gammaproteobacteria bacterium GWE2_42_36]HCU05180.1 hypothetical protein [Coxiellaceae bacterium]
MKNTACHRGLLDPTNATLAHIGEARGTQVVRRLIVIDQAILDVYRDQLRAYFAAWHIRADWKVIDRTNLKTKAIALEIAHAMSQAKSSHRVTPVIAIGCGDLLDRVGLAARMHHQRVSYIRVPVGLMG